jgi:phosphoribosylformimino-5-aminoimidazole carboxamide ribotide isomerase
MIVIPAIDLKDGKCVRLRQGRMDSSTVFNDEPSAQAREWEELGAGRAYMWWTSTALWMGNRLTFRRSERS